MDGIPNEIFLEILTFLKWTDLKNVRLVCHLWYELSHKVFTQICKFNAAKLLKDDSGEMKNWIQSKNISFHTISLMFMSHCFENPEVCKIFNDLMYIFSQRIRKLLIPYNVPEEQLKLIFDRCSKLQCLKVAPEEAFNYRKIDLKNIPHMTFPDCSLPIKKLIYQESNLLSKFYLFDLLTKKMPNIEDIEIDIKNLNRCAEDLKRHLCQFIENHAATLKSLSLGTNNGISSMHEYLIIPELQLRHLQFNLFSTSEHVNVLEKTISKLNDMFAKQNKLKSFKCLRGILSNNEIYTIFSNFHELEELTFADCKFEIDWMKHLRNVNKLEDLCLRENTNATLNNFSEVFMADRNERLKTLQLVFRLSVRCTLQPFFNQLCNFPNLMSLSIHFSNTFNNNFNDECIQSIIRLKNLRYLNLYPCGLLTDAALCNPDPNKCISSVKQLQHFELCIYQYTDCELSDASVLELLKIETLKLVSLPQAPQISEEFHLQLSQKCRYSKTPKYTQRDRTRYINLLHTKLKL